MNSVVLVSTPPIHVDSDQSSQTFADETAVLINFGIVRLTSEVLATNRLAQGRPDTGEQSRRRADAIAAAAEWIVGPHLLVPKV